MMPAEHENGHEKDASAKGNKKNSAHKVKAAIKKYLRSVKYSLSWHFYRRLVQRSPLGVVYFFAGLTGNISYRLAKGRRTVMEEELDQLFPNPGKVKDKSRIVKKAFDNWIKVKTEVLLFPTLNREKTRKMISIIHRERLDEALERGRGVILVTFHFGSNRMVLPALGFLGYKVNQVGISPTQWGEMLEVAENSVHYKTMEFEGVCERSLPAKFIYVDNFMRKPFECLKNNEILVIAADGGEGSRRIPVPFLRRTAMISAGPVLLAHKTGAALLPIFTVRQRDDRQTLLIEEPVELESTGQKDTDAINNMRKLTRLAERYIERHPCHYLGYLWLIRTRLDKDSVPFFAGA
jgi:KDO2-lipid IV(A) lauroyltransferase